MTTLREHGIDDPAPLVKELAAPSLSYSQFRDGSVAIVTHGEDVPAALYLRPERAAVLARFVAELAKGDRPRSILDEAREIIHGDREHTHGQPDRNLRAIAAIWTAILATKLGPGESIDAQTVCLMMAGLKLARAANRPSHREHALDVVGYMALMERCGFLEPTEPA